MTAVQPMISDGAFDVLAIGLTITCSVIGVACFATAVRDWWKGRH